MEVKAEQRISELRDEEKEEIFQGLGLMNETNFATAIAIARSGMPALKDIDNDEIELELHRIPDSVAHQLLRFIRFIEDEESTEAQEESSEEEELGEDGRPESLLNEPPYRPYRSHFSTIEEAQEYLFKVVDTRSASTIEMAETRYMQDNIQAYVKRLYYAMTDLSKMKDMKGVIGEKGVALGRRVGSPAWRAWAYERRYPRKNIEAKAWQVMISFLDFVRNGCQLHEYELRHIKNEEGDKDKDLTPGMRFKTIVKGCKVWKCICEDIMNNESNIKMFVMAPNAYIKTKEKQKDSNDKRAIKASKDRKAKAAGGASPRSGGDV